MCAARFHLPVSHTYSEDARRGKIMSISFSTTWKGPDYKELMKTGKTSGNWARPAYSQACQAGGFMVKIQ